MPNTNTLDNLELRSESVQEVLSNPPSWLIRYGITLIFAIILMIIMVSWVVKYPDFVQATTLITTENPPEKLQARINGKIEEVFIQNGEEVKQNTVLAAFESNGNVQDILTLKSYIDTLSGNSITQIPMNKIGMLNLGDLETEFSQLQQAYTEYSLNKNLRPYSIENTANSQALSEFNGRIKTLQSQQRLEEAKYRLAQQNFNRNQKLFNEGVISAQELETERISFLQSQQNLENIKISISQLRDGINSTQKAIKGTSINKTKDNTIFKNNLIQSFNNFKKSLKTWEQNYLLVSSVKGKVNFQQNIGRNQFINAGEIMMTILPNASDELIAKLLVPTQNSGKIEEGQKVQIKLDNYPFEQFGMIEGKVKSISTITDKDGMYFIEASLPKGLQTSYKKRVPFNKELNGTAEIITEDLRLIERFFYQFRKIFQYQ